MAAAVPPGPGCPEAAANALAALLAQGVGITPPVMIDTGLSMLPMSCPNGLEQQLNSASAHSGTQPGETTARGGAAGAAGTCASAFNAR